MNGNEGKAPVVDVAGVFAVAHNAVV